MLTFDVNKQIITRTDNNVAIADSVDYLTATFSFSEEWENCSKTVIFRFCHTVKSLVLENDSCIVPWEVIKSGGFEVSVIGVYGSVLITTNVINVPCGISGYAEGEAPEPPTPTQWAQIMSILAHLQGGATNEVLAKRSSADYDFKFVKNGGGGGGGSSVEWTQLLESGTKIATITIDDETYDVYAPTPFSGKYADLSGKPTIPSALSDLTSDSTHRTVTDAEKTLWDGKSVVACTQELSTGTLIGTITINGTTVNLYAPNGGGGGDTVAWSQILSSGTKIGTITINGTPTDVYAPTAPTKVSDLLNDSNFSVVSANPTTQGTEADLESIEIDGTKYVIPSGGEQYELPVASANALGGIRAENKTSSETNEIKVDPNSGKLYVGNASSADIESAVNAYLTLNPPSVADGSITKAKLATAIQGDVDAVDAILESDDIQYSSGSGGVTNLLDIPDTQATTLKGVTFTIQDNVITLNGTSTGVGYIKLTNGVETGTSAPTSWTQQSVSNLIVGHSYGCNQIELGGTASKTGHAISARDSGKTSILSPAKGLVELETGIAYVQFYFPSGATYNNFRLGLIIAEDVFPTTWGSVPIFNVLNGKALRISGKNISLIGGYTDGSNRMGVQGMTTDGTYIYCGILQSTDESQNTLVYKIDPTDGTIVSQTKTYSLGHCNGMAYCPIDRYIHCVAMDNLGTIHRIDTSLNYVDSYTINVSSIYPGYTGVGAISYNANRHQFCYLLRGDNKGYIVTDDAHNFENIVWTKHLTGTYGGIDTDDNFIYQNVYSTGDDFTAVFAWNGKYVGSFNFGGNGELEDIAIDGNKIYYSSINGTYTANIYGGTINERTLTDIIRN